MNIEHVVKMVVAEVHRCGTDHDRSSLAENLAERLEGGAFELENAANQFRYSAGDVRKGTQLSPQMYTYVTNTSLAALRAVLTTFEGGKLVAELRRRIDEYQDTFRSRHMWPQPAQTTPIPEARDSE